MVQISENIFCDEFVINTPIENRLLPNPYYDYPYMIIRGFMDESLCREITDSIYESSNAAKAMVKSMLMGSVLDPTVNEEIRKTNIYDLPDLYCGIYQSLFAEHQGAIERFFNLSLTLATKVQALEYEPGAFYIKHADDSNDLVDKEGNCVGFNCVAPQRKLTSVLFTTSHTQEDAADHYSFSGGELLFNYLYESDGSGVIYHPQAGDMILFFSNPVFSHEVREVLSGYRVSLVQWHNAIVS